MSEKNTAKEAKEVSKDKKTDASGEKKKSARVVAEKKETKVVWTLERCMRFARRFSNEQIWAASHSSSYKSATAHGWVSACVAEIGRVQASGGKVLSANFKKTTSSDTASGKKAA